MSPTSYQTAPPRNEIQRYSREDKGSTLASETSHATRWDLRRVTLRVRQSVLDHFKAGGKKGYQTRINAVLESYVRAQTKNQR